MSLLLKDPASLLDYAIDWSISYLSGEQVIESDWSVIPTEPGGITIDGSTIDADRTVVKVSGGVVGRVYRLLNHITTDLGREDQRSIILRVEQR